MNLQTLHTHNNFSGPKHVLFNWHQSSSLFQKSTKCNCILHQKTNQTTNIYHALNINNTCLYHKHKNNNEIQSFQKITIQVADFIS